MNSSINVFGATITWKSVVFKMFIGYMIGLAVISLFIFGVDHPDPDWGAYWRVRPLVITPLVAAFSSWSFYLKDLVGSKSKWVQGICAFISFLVFMIALWLGIVLGLDGTLWN